MKLDGLDEMNRRLVHVKTHVELCWRPWDFLEKMEISKGDAMIYRLVDANIVEAIADDFKGLRGRKVSQ